MTDINVVAIYQYTLKKKGKLERGTVHIAMKDMGIDIKNIKYHINSDKTVFVSLPPVPYNETKEDGNTKTVWVHSILFHDIPLGSKALAGTD